MLRSGAIEPGGRQRLIDPDVVLAWGGAQLRDLPWRAERDPWAILVAEVMLQQTQAERVIPKWHSFLARFPDPAACATSSLADVLRLWQGLGYPRRARNLRAAATIVVAEHDGDLPGDLDALMALPGVGPYTARAVLAFAFERDVAVVDTNIARVLARTHHQRFTPKGVQAIADGLVPRGAGWMWNQVLMDLGATVCRPSPNCDRCPVAATCAWQCAGRAEPDPALRSAGVSRIQRRFEGSDRQARGKILAALNGGSLARSQFDERILATLVADGLVTVDAESVRLAE